MIQSVGLSIVCGVLIFWQPAIAAEANKTVQGMQTVAPGKTTPKVKTPSGVRRHSVLSTGNMALTADECTTLGGQSVGESACISGKACETTTESGEWKRVCLSKKE